MFESEPCPICKKFEKLILIKEMTKIKETNNIKICVHILGCSNCRKIFYKSEIQPWNALDNRLQKIRII